MPMSEQGRESFKNSCSIADSVECDPADNLRVWATTEMAEEEASEVCVHALVSNDEFIAECEAWHKSSLLEPKDGGEGTGEKDNLNGSNTTSRSANEESLSEIQRRAQPAFFSPSRLHRKGIRVQQGSLM